MRREVHRLALGIALAAAAIGASGCQVIWASITSPSDWVSGTGTAISGFFEGISVSSGSHGGVAANDALFGDDVRLYAAATARDGAFDVDDARELGRIALRHGVSHWEATPVVFRAIGAGLCEAGRSESELERALAGLGLRDARARALVREGFRAGSL
jgi:hypothetical protein